MKITAKILSILLALCMAVSLVTVGVVPAAADTTYVTYAQDTIGGSNILHCFDWSYSNIQAALPDIAAAGYTAVQTSPVQPPKHYNASYTDGVNQWWKLYQPLDLAIADGNTWLGTKAQLTSLCTEADKYGIKVIVDIVANHVANKTSGGGYAQVNTDVASDLQNIEYYHSDTEGISDDNRYTITQRHMGQPDLNTGNSYIQTKVLNLLKDCIDCGVDGFRFDAAKHIELPNDSAPGYETFSSQFWPTVINGATAYASSTYSKDDLFFYGEILGGAGTDISNYTTYMAVTDNYTGDRALDKAYWDAASELADGTYYKGASADKSVLWVESHDTYMGNSGSAGFSNTKDVTSDVLAKAWAIVGARASSTGLYFARPNSTMGAASTDTAWKSTAVAEVNKFKNHFVGTSEYLASSGNTAYIERGDKGVVISKLDGGGAVSLTANRMKSGTYTDQITGNTFTVSNGTISGTVGGTGVAVVYNPTEPTISASTLYVKPSAAWLSAGGRYAMYVFNSMTNANAWVSMTEAEVSGTYGAALPEGTWTNVIFCRMNDSNNTNNWDNKLAQTDDLYPGPGTDLYTVSSDAWSVYDPSATEPATEPSSEPATETPTEAPSDTYTIYAIDNAGWNTSPMKIYWWGSSGSNPDWASPIAMTSVSGTKVYSYNIPKDVDGIIFRDSTGKKQTANIENGIEDGAVWTITGSSNNYSVSKVTCYLVGTMNGWSRNDAYAFTLNTAETSAVEYKLTSVTLPAGAEFKVNNTSNNWFPSGSNHSVSSAGTYDIYFRPNGDGDSTWLSDSNDASKRYIKLVNVTPCTVTWNNYDGTELAAGTVPYGTTPTYSGETPTKESTASTVYTFSGWSPEPAAVTGDVTYTAQFAETTRTFTVTWKNYDGTVLETDEDVAYGSRPAYNGTTPTRKADGDTTYAFSGWSPQITDETVITADTTYIARFGTNTRTYTITWVDGDGNTLRTEPCIEGLMPSYTGTTPTKTANAQYTYTFNNTWDPPLVAAEGDTTYTAQFDATVNNYTITFENYDGTELQSSQAAYGSTPAYTGAEPTRPSTLTHSYTFSGWSPAIASVTEDATYTAQFTENPVDTYTVKATNVVGWDNVYVYYWGAGSDNSWPGVAMTPDSDSFVYTADIPVTAQGVIFNNGDTVSMKQTVDITAGIADNAHWAILNKKDATYTSKYMVNTVPTYYLLGSMNSWTAANAPVLLPHKNSDKVEEYSVITDINSSDKFKIYSSDDSWYPGGDNLSLSESARYRITYRPNAEELPGSRYGAEKLFRHSLTISDGCIGVNFYLPDDAADIQVDGESADGTATENGIRVQKRVSSAEMTKKVTVTCTIDGVPCSDSFSVRDYAAVILSSDSEDLATTRALVTAMLNYGAAAQVYFNKDINDPANSILSADDKMLPNSVTAATINKPYNEEAQNHLPAGVTLDAVTLSLKSELTLSLYFISDSSLTFSNAAGKTVDTVADSSNSKKTIARIRGITAPELGNDITLTVSDGANSGTITYNPMTYCYNALNRDSVSANLKGVARALYCYQQAADAYFSDNN